MEPQWLPPKAERYPARGYRVLAPAWPGLDEPPVIIGHPFGGAIASAAVKGVLPLPYSTLKSAWPLPGNPANGNKAMMLTPRQFHHAFTHTLREEESAAAYERYHVPGSARLPYQAAFAKFNPRATTKINFPDRRQAPLLFIAGEHDHIAPPKVNKANVRLHHTSPAVTEHREFPGRTHFIIGQDGWEEVADHALDWAARHIPHWRGSTTVWSRARARHLAKQRCSPAPTAVTPSSTRRPPVWPSQMSASSAPSIGTAGRRTGNAHQHTPSTRQPGLMPMPALQDCALVGEVQEKQAAVPRLGPHQARGADEGREPMGADLGRRGRRSEGK